MSDALQIYDIVQFSPEHNYAGQLAVVEEVKPWGGQGVLFIDRETKGLVRWKGLAYVRFKFDDVAKVGRVEWWSGWVR